MFYLDHFLRQTKGHSDYGNKAEQRPLNVAVEFLSNLSTFFSMGADTS